MPPDFPTAAFERTYVAIGRHRWSQPQPYEQFNAAWNAISIRFLTLTAAADSYALAIKQQSSGNAFEARYQQERYLFEFFVNALAAIESHFYGLFAIGAILKATAFPFTTDKQQQAVSPSSTQRMYAAHFIGDAINGVIGFILGDTDYSELKVVRNVLAHRTAPGRTVYASAATPPPPKWKLVGMVIDDTTLVGRRANVARVLTTLITASATFVEAQFT
jgi:hypothetical protein